MTKKFDECVEKCHCHCTEVLQLLETAKSLLRACCDHCCKVKQELNDIPVPEICPTHPDYSHASQGGDDGSDSVG
jgi:hypothetical protein